MVISLSIISIFISILVSLRNNGRAFTVSTLFTIIWAFFLSLSSLGLYGLYIPSIEVYLMSFVSIFVFNIAAICSHEQYFASQYNGIHGEYNIRRIYLLHLFVYIFSIPYVSTSIKYMFLNGIVALRAADLSSLQQNTYIALAFQWICLPFFTTTIIAASVCIALKMRQRILTLLAVIDIAIYAITYGGRYIIAKFIFYIVAAIIVVNQGTIKFLIKKYLKALLLVAIAMVAIVYITSFRKLSGFNFLGNIVGYFSGSLCFLSALLKYNTNTNYLGYGSMTFGFIVNFFKTIGKIILGIEYNGSDAIFTSFAGDYLKIGNNTMYNSLPTMLYAFILDFGLWFFWIGVLLLATFSLYIEKRFYKRRDIMSLSIYMYALFVVFDTILVYDYISTGAFMTFFFLIFVTYNVHILPKSSLGK